MNNNNNCVTTIELYIIIIIVHEGRVSSRHPGFEYAVYKIHMRHDDGNGRHRIRLGSCDVGAALWEHRVDVFKFIILLYYNHALSLIKLLWGLCGVSGEARPGRIRVLAQCTCDDTAIVYFNGICRLQWPRQC